MKNPNNILIALITLIILSAVSDCISQRNTIWIRGASQNSNGWGNMKQVMEAKGFLFEDLADASLDHGLGVIAAADQIEGMIGNNDNVLGIAHDYGGIVLRNAQLQDSSISAMILSGVPNQGSTAISQAISADPGNLSRAQQLIERVNDIREGDNCDNCGTLNAFESWINSIEGGSEFLDDVAHGSTIINDLGEPTVPFAIMWGSVEELSLHSMMDSRVNSIDLFTQCFVRKLGPARRNADDAMTRSLIDNTIGFFNSVVSAVSSIVDTSTSSPSAIINAIANYLTTSRQNIISRIEAVRETDEALARILRCELSNQFAATDWQLLLMENSDLEETEVEIPTDYTDCIQDCALDMAFGDWNSNLTCNEACSDSAMGPNTESVFVFVSDPNDGLLTETEQKLEGYAGEPYHLMNTNHFQETSASNDDAVDALEDIFMGGAGAAFIVPK